MNNKAQFCLYLEEVAAELRAFPSTREYLRDVCQTLIDNIHKFEIQELEENRLRSVFNDDSQ